MVEVLVKDSRVHVCAENLDLLPRHRSQLDYWGFKCEKDENEFALISGEASEVVPKILNYFDKQHILYRLAPDLQEMVDEQSRQGQQLCQAMDRCRQFKEARLDLPVAKEFINFLATHIRRTLKEHQVKAALHLLYGENAANFSVPGSGKTTVVLSVYERLRQLDVVDALFIVGPPACFGPWRNEYNETLGRQPSFEVLAGGDIDIRRHRYHANRETACDIYLTSFQTLQNDWEHVRVLFQRQGVRFFLVIDEAHYIKQIGGSWANAVLNVAKHATRRCVLTGTPFPKSYSDAFNLFDVLWPEMSPLNSKMRHQIVLHSQRNEFSEAAAILSREIGPLFYRVRKPDLHLAPQVFHDPIRIPMNPVERRVYDAILERIIVESRRDFFRDFELLVRLRRGRMIRLRQCISDAGLLTSAVTDYQEDLVHDDISIGDAIHHYHKVEVPAKINILLQLVKEKWETRQKIVVWANFVGTLKLIVSELEKAGHQVGLIYGGTPFERAHVQEEATREEIIREFVDITSSMSVLVANPAACSESISLHKACSTAIYYDLSYNCAQYLQSLDRIHRVGGSENKEAHYYFLQYQDTIDSDILLNVRQKALNMSDVVDEDFPIYSLDMFAEDEELEAYVRLFGGSP